MVVCLLWLFCMLLVCGVGLWVVCLGVVFVRSYCLVLGFGGRCGGLGGYEV